MSKKNETEVRKEPAQTVVEGSGDAEVTGLVRLWPYRRVVLIAALLGVVTTGLIYFTASTEHLATLKFRLLFEGADVGTYPSGMKFSTEDIIARSVLQQVYDANKLKGRYGDFEDFQGAFYVAAGPSAEMEALDSEYSSKLTNRKLTAVERTQLEQEYREKRGGLAHGVDYDLTMNMSLGFALPDELREKVVRDILATWALDAKERKGAVKYQIAVLTQNVLPDSMLDEDYFIAADMLRLKVKAVLENITEVMALPGAKSYRSTKDNYSLTEISTNLMTMHRFKLEPAMHIVQQLGLAKEEERKMTMRYIQRTINNITVAKTETTSRAKALEDALTTYMQDSHARSGKPAAGKNGTTGPPIISMPAMIPQFGDSFLDRIIKMASESEDIKFRQSYTDRITAEALSGIEYDSELKLYTDMLEAMQDDGQAENKPKLTPEERKAVTAKIESRISSAHAELVLSTQQINAIFEQLSSKNLNPTTELYSAPEPVVTVEAKSISHAKLLVYLVAIVATMVFLASVGCLYHARIRSLKRAAA